MVDLKLAAKVFVDLRYPARDRGGVTRPSYGHAETYAMKTLSLIARDHHLAVATDAAANAHVVLLGDGGGLLPVACGSHLDSVPCGGNYDGAAGVVAGLLALIELKKRGPLRRPVKLIMLRGEESAWFGKCYLGSLGLAGRLTEADLHRIHRGTGKTLYTMMKDEHGSPENLAEVAKSNFYISPANYHAFLELHIEQGPVLEAEDIPLGIVTGIRGNVRMQVTCHGESGHSGTTPMHMRRDALMGAVALVSEVERRAREVDGGLVYTVGQFHTDAERDAASVIADKVTFTIEWRSLDSTALAEFEALLKNTARNVSAQRSVRFDFDVRTETMPAWMSDRIQSVMRGICDSEPGKRYKSMPSGAGHDAAVFAQQGVETGMIFIRNQNGSHNPREDMRLDDFGHGVEVLTETLYRLAMEE